jgi:hypothetical protein
MGKEYDGIKGSKEIFEHANALLGFDMKSIMINGPSSDLKKMHIGTNAMIISA